MEINIYGYDKQNNLVAVSAVAGNIHSFVEEDLPKDVGKGLLVDALITAGDAGKDKIFKTLVCITGEKK